MIDWQRKRHPEEVPTPVAVALSDFCRRAKAPASPALVRDALALLTEADDARVRALADGEPAAKPLGPFAVVDLLAGTAVETAAQRQEDGYYERERKKAASRPQAPVAPPAPLASFESPPPRPRASAPPAGPPKPKRTRAETVQQKIAPKKRKAGEAEPVTRPPAALPGTAFLPKRNLPAPRGRFTTVDPTRATFESLFRPSGRDTVAALVDQVPHRVALLRALEQGYTGRRGEALTVGDVEDLLEAHELFDAIQQKERDGALAAVLEQKGSIGRAAKDFGMSAEELELLVDALGLKREVKEIRDRFIKEALAPENLSLRLELLFRTRYLEDLRIDRKFTTALEAELRALVDEVRDAATSVPTLVDLLSRQHALHPESLRRALEKLGLLEPWLRATR